MRCSKPVHAKRRVRTPGQRRVTLLPRADSVRDFSFPAFGIFVGELSLVEPRELRPDCHEQRCDQRTDQETDQIQPPDTTYGGQKCQRRVPAGVSTRLVPISGTIERIMMMTSHSTGEASPNSQNSSPP